MPFAHCAEQILTSAVKVKAQLNVMHFCHAFTKGIEPGSSIKHKKTRPGLDHFYTFIIVCAITLWACPVNLKCLYTIVMVIQGHELCCNRPINVHILSVAKKKKHILTRMPSQHAYVSP